MTSRTKFKHSEDVKAKAIRLFERDFGYKATAKILDIPVYTVRDWKRDWKAGFFKASNLSCAELLREVMIEQGQEFFWRGNESVIHAVMQRSDRLSLSREGIQKVMTAVKRSSFFSRMPALVYMNSVAHPVWRLLPN